MTNPLLSKVHDRIGGIPGTLGPWQRDLLLARGLTPSSTLLDLGCGTLRGGLLLVPELEPGKYTGVDPLAELVAEGGRLIREAGLEEKRPSLGTLALLDELPHRSQDYVLAQSVLNHLDAERIRETVWRVAQVLADDGRWVVTAKLSDTVDGVDPGIPHPSRPNERLESLMGIAWFDGLLNEFGLLRTPLDEWVHPRGLDVFEIVRDVTAATTAVASELATLVGIDTSPDGKEHVAAVDWLSARLRDSRFDVDAYGDGPAPLIVARRPATGGRGTVVVYGHYDVDHVEGVWATAPFELCLKDSRWYGLGVADNKGALASRLVALDGVERSPEILWLIQGEEESGSTTLRRYVEEVGLPSADWYLDENGWTARAGSQRILAFRVGDEGHSVGLRADEVAYLDEVVGVVGRPRHVEARPLNKVFVEGGCPFQKGIPHGGRYVAIGTNDAGTRIHAPDESIPVAGAIDHVLQFRAFLHAVAEGGV